MTSTFPSKSKHQLENPIESEIKRHKCIIPTQSKHHYHHHYNHHNHLEESLNKQDHTMQEQHNYNSNTASHNPTHGTFTPITQSHSHEFLLNLENKVDIEMITEDSFVNRSNEHQDHHHQQKEEEELIECPCGHMHGPGQGTQHDIHAVGLLDIPLLRGPD